MTTSIRSSTFGGNDGGSFDDSHNIDVWGRITQIFVRSGKYVDSIGVGYANGKFINHGGTGGGESVINLGPDEIISKVLGRSGKYVDQIMFLSSKGAVYGPFGGRGRRPFHGRLPR